MRESLFSVKKEAGKEEPPYSEPLWIGHLLNIAGEKAGPAKGKKMIETTEY